MDRLLQQNKQNRMEPNNQMFQDKSIDYSFHSTEKSTQLTQLQQNRYEFVENLKQQTYQQQKKNKKIYDKIIQINKYFGYKLIQRSIHDYRQATAIKQHEALLQQQTNLLKQLAKIQCIQNQADPFRFLIDTANKNKTHNYNSQEKIQNMNKNIIFIKKNIQQITKKIQNQTMQSKGNFIVQSQEYSKLQKDYQNALNQIQAINSQNKLKLKLYEQEIEKLKRVNTQITQQKTSLKEKVIYYEDKSKQLISQVAKLSNKLSEKEKIILQMNQINKENDSQAIQHLLLDQSNISSIGYHNSSLTSQDQQQNSLSQLINLQENNKQIQISKTSTKKNRVPVTRNVIFSGCKKRELFPSDQSQLQILQQKSMRFIRRK